MITSQLERPIPVAQYLRMSTEHQRYSTTNQREAIEKYVAEHAMEVVRTYEDSGRSGLTLAERPALKELLADVNAPERPFKGIIVFDVSRWGRFQDVDESAYYEFLCRRAGVQVVYCAEPFGEVPGPMSVVIKSVKRAMAAEFSRELGCKVWTGKCQLARRGFHMGGFPSFALRRVLVSETGEVKGVLGRRELKSIQTDRVLLQPADALDVALVRHIFGLFVRKRLKEADVARVLNWSCYPGRTSGLHLWSAQTVRDILRNERYAGNLVYNRRSCRLKTPWVKNPPEAWIRKDKSFPSIVSQATFDEAHRLIIEGNRHFWAAEEMLDMVRQVHKEHGVVSPSLMQRHGFPNTTLFITHFGSLADACVAAGLEPSERLAAQRRLVTTRRTLKLHLLEELARRYRAIGVNLTWARSTRRACIEGGPTISVRTVQAFRSKTRCDYWLVTPDLRVMPDFSIVARVALDSPAILDFFLLPAAEKRNIFIGVSGKAAHEWAEPYRHATLDDVFYALEAVRKTRGSRMLPRLTVNLAKRRRRMLGIRKREQHLRDSR